MSASRNQAQPSAARQVGRLVAISGKQETKAPPESGTRRFRGGGPSVAAVFERLMQPPAPPPPRPPSSTAAVLRGLVRSPAAGRGD